MAVCSVYWISHPTHTDIFSQGYVGVSKNAQKRFKQHFEIRLQGSEEEEAWMEVYLNPIFLENGNIEEVSGIARDISDLKKNQKNLYQYAN